MSEVVVAMGLCTPLGATAERTMATMRAGISRFVETEVIGADGEPVRASRLVTLPPKLPRTARMIGLARAALAGVRDALESSRAARVGLYLGLPEPGLGAPFDAGVIAEVLREDTGQRLDLVASRETGRASFFDAIAAARADLRGGRAGSYALVGAVDSFCDPDSLQRISDAGLPLSRRNLDGRIVGEAAGFVLLARPGAAESMGPKPLATVLATASGVERAPFASREPSLSEGLTDVFRQLRKDPIAGRERAGVVMACQPAESFWGTEFMRAYLRNADLMPEPLTVVRACDSVGDAGAGAAPVMLAAAISRLSRPSRRAARALVYGCSDGGKLGAMVIEPRVEG